MRGTHIQIINQQHADKKIIALFVSATLFISCSSLSATSNQTNDLILGKWDCLTTMQIADEELAVTMTFKHKDILTKTDWLSNAEGVILVSTATE
ncbi:hypothetical protein GCM10009007_14370 [Formosimonas limnophila]|uniref:Lipocalin-like domain-containing protein n=1 Tax=Formosimonas limnophila TaxID=1384487 RepID=A0A8J3CMW5_9BURK|nr:hypothetical protein GCM10009007_14370 [Formosimonas limnophila]